MAGIASEALRQALRGIRAYHGSPHNFERFSLEHIGRGEGAQAYGHGLYFAENEAVARGYRDQISKDVFAVGNGGRIWNPSGLEHLNVRVRAGRGDIGAAIESAKSVIDSPTMPEATRAMARRDLAVLEGIQAEGGIRPHTGHMYEVNIGAEPERFIDWDAPLKDQPEVRERLRAVPRLARQPALFDSEHATGMNAWLSGDVDHAARANALREQGIAGVKYLDQGSRDWRILRPEESTSGKFVVGRWPGGGPEQRYFDNEADALAYFQQNQSRNYTVFDDSLVDILRKYGIAGIGVGTGGTVTLREALRDRATA